jgi:capsular polysaccharide biosynthesis protein
VKQRAALILFAHKRLILLPILLIVPLAAIYSFLPKPKLWQSTAVVWVDQPQANYQQMDLGWTPAGNQQILLNALLHTKSFTQSVLAQTELAPKLADPRTTDATLNYFRKSVSVTSTEANFMTIQVGMSSPDLSWKAAQGIVSSYQKVLVDRGQTLTDAYLSDASDQLKQATQALTSAQTQLSNYLTAHPELGATTGVTAAVAAVRDPNLALMQQQAQDAQNTYTAARQHYLDVQSAGAAGRSAAAVTFSVIDQPQRPLAPVSQGLKSRLQSIAIGLALGIMVSSGVAALLLLLNHSVVSKYDASTLLDLPILAEVPELSADGAGVDSDDYDSVRQRVASPARL